MKKNIALILAVLLSLCLTGCGKSQAVIDTENAIRAIGEVNLNSRESIERAERLYSILTDNEKSKIKERQTLVEARQAYEKLIKTTIYSKAKELYDILNGEYRILSNMIDDATGAVSFVFNQSINNNYPSDVLEELTKSIPHLTRDELEKAIAWYSLENGIDRETIINRFSQLDADLIMYILGTHYATSNDVEKIDSEASEAKTILQELNEVYNDQLYYPKLKEYYLLLDAYPNFFDNIDFYDLGSYLNISSTINNARKPVEKEIIAIQKDLDLLFNR